MKKKSARRWREANPLSLVFNSIRFRRRRRVSIYIKYTCRRLETRKYNYHLNASPTNSIQTPIKSERATCEKDKACTYTLYYRREETKYNRSEWCTGSALSFSHIDVGAAFQFINHMSRSKERQSGVASG